MQLSKALYVLHLLHITDTFNFVYFKFTELYGVKIMPEYWTVYETLAIQNSVLLCKILVQQLNITHIYNAYIVKRYGCILILNIKTPQIISFKTIICFIIATNDEASKSTAAVQIVWRDSSST